MTQRNPMNERYTSDEHKGTTKKSAASAKPKSNAAGTVTIKSQKKTPQEKKAQRKQAEAKAREEERRLAAKYSKPDTPEYKKWKNIWWGALVAAVVFVIISYILRNVEPVWISFAILGLAYVAIIFAFWVDMARIKKILRAYQSEMLKKEIEEKKKNRGKSKKQIAEEEAAELEEERATQQSQKKHFFKRKSKEEETKTEESE